jgi:hypothetical protein
MPLAGTLLDCLLLLLLLLLLHPFPCAVWLLAGH